MFRSDVDDLYRSIIKRITEIVSDLPDLNWDDYQSSKIKNELDLLIKIIAALGYLTREEQAVIMDKQII